MKKTVLVVDDFENTRFVVEFTLKNKGYDVIQASNGKEALKYLDGRPLDLVITDLNMPEMNGIELVQNIRNLSDYAYIPILVLTTDRDEAKKENARKARVTAWIQKPFKMDKFVSIVNMCLKN
jgi:two-component system chemotaxis response regulator CheY